MTASNTEGVRFLYTEWLGNYNEPWTAAGSVGKGSGGNGHFFAVMVLSFSVMMRGVDLFFVGGWIARGTMSE